MHRSLLTIVTMSLAASYASATALPFTPVPITDTEGNYTAIYPHGGVAQNTFSPIAPGQLNFTLDFTGVDPDLLDAYAVVEVRMDTGFQGGNLRDVNVVGPIMDGTDSEGLLIGGTLQMFTQTQWSFASDGTPISLSFASYLPTGIAGTLSVDFASAVPEASTGLMMSLGGGGLWMLARRRRWVPALA